MNLFKLPMKIAGAACGVVSIVLGIAAIALPKWMWYDANGAQLGYGLWSLCTYVPSKDHAECTSNIEKPVIAFAVAFAFLHILIANNNKVAGKLSGPIAIVGGILMIVGFIVWAAKYKSDPVLVMLNLSAGFILAIVSAIMSFIAGNFIFLGWIAESRGQTHMVV
ncbi:hypothetical protein ACJMK2_003946 [Sinanodonta woodiana]|uniref:Uncharacterized protein n=1 Tax=Sinanodonta woodiana TaxID=1069815 RepID=A0ABD3XZQ7_SINWO